MTKKNTPKKSVKKSFDEVKGKKSAPKITASGKKKKPSNKKPSAKAPKDNTPPVPPSPYLGGGFRCGTIDRMRRNWGRRNGF